MAIQFRQEIPFLSQVTSSEALGIVAELGIFFLVLVAGIEMEPKEIQESVRRHINWHTQGPDLKEDLAHLPQDIKRRVCG